MPEADAKPLYLQFAKLEEDHGLARHALAVYERATKAVADHEKLGVYDIYIARASAFFGLPRTRQIYEVCVVSQPVICCQSSFDSCFNESIMH